MLLQEYVETFNTAQHLVYVQCLRKATISDNDFFKNVRKQLLDEMLAFWGEGFPGYKTAKFGFEPDWQKLDIDWVMTFDGILAAKPKNIFAFLLKITGLDITILNLYFDLNLPKMKTQKDRDMISIAISAAALMTA